MIGSNAGLMGAPGADQLNIAMDGYGPLTVMVHSESLIITVLRVK